MGYKKGDRPRPPSCSCNSLLAFGIARKDASIPPEAAFIIERISPAILRDFRDFKWAIITLINAENVA